jgi:glycosyltransferase involved in cell wall biosynthesis
MATLFSLGLISLCIAWCTGFLYLAWAFVRLPRLERENVPVPSRWPRLSVIIPACNEAAHLESAVETLVQQDYSDLEIILVNDRSTDATGAIIDRLAKNDPQIRALHIRKLPGGWLGKVHALHCGVAKARGEWLLFTDADVHFAPETLRRALAHVLQLQADHLALIPRTIQKDLARRRRTNFRLAVLAGHPRCRSQSSRQQFPRRHRRVQFSQSGYFPPHAWLRVVASGTG